MTAGPMSIVKLLIGVAGTGAETAGAPPYHGRIDRILQERCQDCHRPGQVAPFSLLTYEQARKRAEDLVRVAEDRTMPPWHASGAEGGPFRGARVLPAPDVEALAA